MDASISTPIRPAPDESTPSSWSAWPWVVALLAVSLALRILLLPHRWVNPDEGAHLMDGKLVLEGLVPIVNFDARQVLYVYLLAGWERLVGTGLLAARVLPTLLGVGVAALIFPLARSLVGPRAALAAAATYAFLPIALIWSLNVHLEVVTLVSTCLGYLVLARALRTGTSARLLAATGVIFGITFYIRESALAHLLAAALVLTILGWRAPRRLAQQQLALFGGFLAVAVVAGALFGRHLTPGALWGSSLNPLYLPLKALGKVTGVTWVGAAVPGSGESVRALQQPWPLTLRNLRDAIGFGSFLLLAAAAAFGSRALGRKRIGDDVAFLVLAAWLGSLGLAYGYWVYAFGFYPQYFTEFLPPLAILFGAVASAAADDWLPPRTRAPALVLFLLAAVGAFTAGAKLAVPAAAYIAVAALAVAAGGVGRTGIRRWCVAAGVVVGAAIAAIALGSFLPAVVGRGLRLLFLLLGFATVVIAIAPVRRALAERLGFAVLALLGASALMAYDYSGHKIGLAYNCVWPRSVLMDVSRRVAAISRPGDEVLSGAVIWALEADRRPFLNISHPLGFRGGVPPADRLVMDRALETRPPRVIVLDGYTERTILGDPVARARLLDERYRPVGEVPGGRFLVRLFVLRAGVATLDPRVRPGGGP